MVYVDDDPVCLAHGRAYLDHDEYNSMYLPGNITNPVAVFDNPRVRIRITSTTPWAVVIGTVLPHIGDDRDPARIMRQLIEALPAGSYVVLTHYCSPHDGGPAERLALEVQQRYLERLESGWFRNHATVASYLSGLHILPPGLVSAHHWWPPGPPQQQPPTEQQLILAAIAHKPITDRNEQCGDTLPTET